MHLKRLPVRVVRERRGEVDHLLTEHARTFDPGGADHLARHLLSVITPDRADRYDQNALDRRHLGIATDQTGMVLLSGQLDQAGGLTVATVLDHFVEKDRAAATETDPPAPILRRTCGPGVSAEPTPWSRWPAPRPSTTASALPPGRCRGSWSSPPRPSSPAPKGRAPPRPPTAPWSAAAR